MKDLIWGRNSVDEALKSDRILEAIVVDGSPYIKKFKDKHIPFSIKKRGELDRLSKGQNHQGVIVKVKAYPTYELRDIIKANNGLIVLLDGIEDPHNLGAIMRSVDCVGGDGIIIPRHGSASLSPTVAKVASGAMEHVKVVEVNNLKNTIESLKKQGYWIVGTDASAKQMYNEIKYDMNVCLVIGSEGKGMSRLVKEACDFIVKLPMYGHVNSLNASVATAVMLYKIIENR